MNSYFDNIGALWSCTEPDQDWSPPGELGYPIGEAITTSQCNYRFEVSFLNQSIGFGKTVSPSVRQVFSGTGSRVSYSTAI